ncbi:MAG: FAD-dependent oxidoreductase [Acidobacteriota bacterium]
MSVSRICVLGAGIQGCCLALALARRGLQVDLVDRRSAPMNEASLHTEGKIHLGFVYAKDPQGETHRLMIRGSLAFAEILRDLAQLEPGDYARGTRFYYAVPRESQLDVEAIEAHFESIEGEISALPPEASYLGRPFDFVYRRLEGSEHRRYFCEDSVQAAYETAEQAVDTLALASHLRARVLASPRIRFVGATRVVDAEIEPLGTVRLIFENATREGGDRRGRSFPAVANCLWAGRLALDAALGLTPQRRWLHRYKAIARWRSPESPVPSTTLIHGSFGDVVHYGQGNHYASWYPSFKLAQTDALDGSGLAAALESLDRQRLAREGLDSLARYLPGLRATLRADPRFEVSGGVIFSWGSTDIDDPASGLHERWRVGPARHGAYVTVDTGKYTTAPLFALEAARLLAQIVE